MKGETVSQKQASHIAQLFFNTAYGQYVAEPKLVWNGRQLTTDRLFSPFYVYNHPKGGFVIISAENKAFPILAYSTSNKFSREKLGEEEKNQLKKFAHEIELIRYDSREPVRAIRAWQNLPSYIYNTVANPYATIEFRNLPNDKKEVIERIDRRNGWVIMPTSVEFEIYNPEEYRDYTLDDVTAEAESEDIPFKFYEDFIDEIKRDNFTRAAAFDEIISPSKPVVSILGGAHFSIAFPDNIKMSRVYSLEGAKMMERYYGDTNIMNLDISNMPAGFYVVLTLSDDGKVYGIKIYR
ncbi:MAG: Spi family protease inhibitor [Candidatus Amulumruptor caecigallinarius]|nr:Spi family protease inhibitor [Candidatus Amulumruptor caecigallinarius]